MIKLFLTVDWWIWETGFNFFVVAIINYWNSINLNVPLFNWSHLVSNTSQQRIQWILLSHLSLLVFCLYLFGLDTSKKIWTSCFSLGYHMIQLILEVKHRYIFVSMYDTRLIRIILTESHNNFTNDSNNIVVRYMPTKLRRLQLPNFAILQ